MDKETIGYIIFIILVLSIVIGGAVLGVYLVEKHIQCPNFAQSVQLESKYNFWAGGCFVNYDGQWIDSNQSRAGKID